MTFSTTIFPRINFIKNFGDRLQQRIANGRVAMFFNRLVTGDASLDLDFASTKSLTDSVSGDNLITFTRASSATYVGSDGLIATAATNEPRFDHDPTTGESLGLLIEEARTNLLTHSEQFDQWTAIGTNTTITPNAATAPDGSLTADRIFNPAINSTFLGNGTVTIGTTYTMSVYVKAVTPGTNDRFTLNVGGGPDNSSPEFTATSEWQRFTFTNTPSAISAGLFYINNEGDGFASDIYVWGAQVEEGSFPTSYIPTTSSTVTRAADVAEITGANFSSWYNQSEGAVFIESKKLSSTALSHHFSFNDGSAGDRIIHQPPGFALYVSNGGVAQAQVSSNAYASGDFVKSAIGVAENDFTLVADGTIEGTDNLGTVPVVSQLNIGDNHLNADQINGHIKRLAYFPTRLPDDELIELTV